jgi:hypothetical protein
MKLQYFSNQTLPQTRGGGNKLAKVSFGKGGVISFNGAAAALIGLKSGDKVTLAQDEEDPKCWFFFKDKDHGYELRLGYDKKAVMFNHVHLIDSFNNCFGLSRETKQYLIGGTPTVLKGSKTEYWGVLVHAEPVEQE